MKLVYKEKLHNVPVFIVWILWLGWLAAEWALFILFWVQTLCRMVPDCDHSLSVSGDRQVDHQALPDSVPGSWLPVPRPLLLRSGRRGSVQDHRRGPQTAGQQHGGEVLQVSGHFHSSAHTHTLSWVAAWWRGFTIQSGFTSQWPLSLLHTYTRSQQFQLQNVICRRSCSHVSPCVWNDLPYPGLCHSDSQISLKQNLKTRLSQQICRQTSDKHAGRHLITMQAAKCLCEVCWVVHWYTLYNLMEGKAFVSCVGSCHTSFYFTPWQVQLDWGWIFCKLCWVVLHVILFHSMTGTTRLRVNLL